MTNGEDSGFIQELIGGPRFVASLGILILAGGLGFGGCRYLIGKGDEIARQEEVMESSYQQVYSLLQSNKVDEARNVASNYWNYIPLKEGRE